jgi:hypothetical protein
LTDESGNAVDRRVESVLRQIEANPLLVVFTGDLKNGLGAHGNAVCREHHMPVSGEKKSLARQAVVRLPGGFKRAADARFAQHF